MEYAGNGSLANVLEAVSSGGHPSFWNRTGIGIIICGVVLGMRYVHWRQILHLDLKPSNILITSMGRPWIADFGSSCRVDDATPREEMATIHYAAPELYRDDMPRTLKCDVFSFGLVLYEILTGTPVFSHSDYPFPILRRLLTGDLPKLPAEHGSVMTDLIRDCWHQDPENRPSFQEIFAIFQSQHFDILPGADPVQLFEFCTGVLNWEEQAGIRL
jgi:serine/threonine protein kinase